MITTSPSITHISKALLIFQGQVEGVGKSKNNEFFKSKYATLENVRDTAVPELQTVGVFYIQSPGAIVEGSIGMTTRLIHAESGEWIEGSMDIPLGKKDPQGAGSAITYASRYHLMAMLGLPAVDDDAETAIDRNDKRKEHTPKPTEQPKAIERMSKADSRSSFSEVSEAFRTAETLDALDAAGKRYKPKINEMHADFEEELKGLFKSFRADLQAQSGNAGSFKRPEPDFTNLDTRP